MVEGVKKWNGGKKVEGEEAKDFGRKTGGCNGMQQGRWEGLGRLHTKVSRRRWQGARGMVTPRLCVALVTSFHKMALSEDDDAIVALIGVVFIRIRRKRKRRWIHPYLKDNADVHSVYVLAK